MTRNRSLFLVALSAVTALASCSAPSGLAPSPADASSQPGDAEDGAGPRDGATDASADAADAADAADPADGSTDAGGAVAAGGPVALDGVYNARHVGGLRTSDGRRVRSTVLIRSGHLGNVTSAGCTALTDTLSVRSVVDLRDASDVSATPDAACVLTNTRYLHAELPKILPPTPSSYLETLAAADDRLDGIYAHLTAQGALPALVHCVIGRDRAGIVMALLLLSLGVPRDAVLRDFTDNQEATVDAAWLAAVIDEVESAGGIEAYLASRGVTAQEIAAFQALALE